MNSLETLVKQYSTDYDIVDIVNLDHWFSLDPNERPGWLQSRLKKIYQAVYQDNQRILFTLAQSDEYISQTDSTGLILKNLQEGLNQIDISNFFVVLLVPDSELFRTAQDWLAKNNTDTIPVNFEYFKTDVEFDKRISSKKTNIGYNYNSARPIKIAIEDLTASQQNLLLESKSFCIYPWIHMHVEPNGRVLPCCGTTYKESSIIGKTEEKSLQAIWNDTPMKDLRIRMLNNQASETCSRCYESERAGFFSMRMSANKHHGHNIHLVDDTHADGHLDQFKMLYWDVRFSNICNLRCRSCGPSFSSQWYQDQIKIAPDYANNHKALIFAGKFETDLWEQLIEHIDYVEQIYFAGGEPILMDEHYRILEELERRGKFNVKLIYNTNFTETRLKNRTVFDYWKKFDSVAVGASLDGMWQHGEYIRKGTNWSEVEENRRQMMEICPRVDFYISATLSIMNALHLPDFHRSWVKQGFIKPQDFNVNILSDPAHYRIDIATPDLKKQIEEKYKQHLAWLSPQDPLRRASNGFESAINFMNATDNQPLIAKFWAKTRELDAIRNEDMLSVIPELKQLL
jgi:radical SAM protein with 4Fe4S-binding SPASM domain